MVKAKDRKPILGRN